MLRLREGIEQAMKDREYAEARIKDFQEQLDQLVAEAESKIELKQADIEAARQTLLESFKRMRATEKDMLGFFGGPAGADKRRECGFKSPKKATEWVMQNKDW